MGESWDAQRRSRACLWLDQQPRPLDELVAPGFKGKLYGAVDINDRGQILVRGEDERGSDASFLLTPE